MTDSWNQDCDNFWNQEGVFEELTNDLQDQAEYASSIRMEEAMSSHEEYQDDPPIKKIYYGEYLSRQKLRERCYSLNDYIALLSTKGFYTWTDELWEDMGKWEYNWILGAAITEVCYERLVGKKNIDEWNADEFNSFYIDENYIDYPHEQERYYQKMFQLLKSGGIDLICDWLPSVVKYVEQKRGTTNVEEFRGKSSLRPSDEEVPF